VIFFGKPWWKIALVVVIPSAHSFTVVILIKVLTLVVIMSVLTVPPSVPISVTLGKRQIAGKH
jgi:hypothetical protein